MFRVRFYGKNMMWRNTDTDTESKIKGLPSSVLTRFESEREGRRRTDDCSSSWFAALLALIFTITVSPGEKALQA